MRVDKIEGIVYNEPRVIRLIQAPKEIDPSELLHKTPVEVVSPIYNRKGLVIDEKKNLSFYA